MDREEIIGKVQRRDGNGLHYAVYLEGASWLEGDWAPLSGLASQMQTMRMAPMRENGMIIQTQISHPSSFRKWPRRKPVSPLARYWTPSRRPVTVAAPLVPPKSMEAVPESMPWTPKIHIQVNPTMKAAMAAELAYPRRSNAPTWQR